MSSKDFVTTATCKIVTDATNDKLEARALLVEAQINGIKSTIKVNSVILGFVFTSVQILLNIYFNSK